MNNFKQQTQAQQTYLIIQAMQLILQHPEKEFCSICWLQIMLRIGYNLASDLRDELIERGMVAKQDKDNKCRITLERKNDL